MGVRNRQKQPDIALVVVIDKSGSMDACHCNTFDGGMGGGGAAPGRPQGRHRQGGDPAGRGGADGARRARRRRLRRVGPLGRPDAAARRRSATSRARSAASSRSARRTSSPGWSRRSGRSRRHDRDAAPHHPADRRLVDAPGQYDEIIARMKAAGITLSTVGAGGGANPFLEQLAKQGGGRFYAAANPASIPDIFLKETQQVAGQQIVEEAFFPIQTARSPILRGLEDGLPQLLGYNGTTIKSAAQLVLVSPRDDPLLAQWQYGLGRSVAWTSDSTGRWAKNWVAWPGFNRFFSQLVGWTFPGEETGGIEATFETDGGQTRLHVESVESDGSPRDFYRHARRVVGPGPEPREVGLDQVAPGVYEAQLGEIDVRRVRRPRSRRRGRARRRWAGRWGSWSRRRRVPAARRRTSRSWPRSARRPAGGRDRAGADPWIHDLEDDRVVHRAVAVAARSWPCCCGRSTSRCGACRSGGGSSPMRGRWVGRRLAAGAAPRRRGPAAVAGHARGARAGGGLVRRVRRCCAATRRRPRPRPRRRRAVRLRVSSPGAIATPAPTAASARSRVDSAAPTTSPQERPAAGPAPRQPRRQPLLRPNPRRPPTAATRSPACVRPSAAPAATERRQPDDAVSERAAQQSKANQHNSLRSRWSSSTSSRISPGSWARCHRHSRRPASSRSSSGPPLAQP